MSKPLVDDSPDPNVARQPVSSNRPEHEPGKASHPAPSPTTTEPGQLDHGEGKPEDA